MPRKKAAVDQSPQPQIDDNQSIRKRSHSEVEVAPVAPLGTTPTKRRRESAKKIVDQNGTKEPLNGTAEPTIEESDVVVNGLAGEAQQETLPEPPKATPRKRGRPPKNATPGNSATPKAPRQLNFQTPSKAVLSDDATPRKQALGADRSARRKSARALIEQVVGDDSDDDDLAREIYESSEDNADNETEATPGRSEDEGARTDDAETPLKTTQKRARKRARSPTPPRDLPPHELYFFQNKPGRAKTSNNNLASLDLLTHEEYFSLIAGQQDRHKGDIEYLENLHAESFPQWMFEMSQGFSICLYGFGSKRAVLQNFARKVHARGRRERIVMVNGYAPTTTMREILTTLAVAVDPSRRIPTSPPTTMVQAILAHLSTTDTILTIIVNSIDAPQLRKPSHQSILAQLSSHPQVNLIGSTDTPDFSLLWDIGLRTSFNFAFHDCTTFSPFTVELDIIDDVHELLGRKARRVNGREGVAFVLKSLPENAKNLFQLIVSEVLIATEEDSGEGDAAVEYRMVYNKAVEEFICSSEMAFRTLLKEYVRFTCMRRDTNCVAGFMIIRLLQVGRMLLAQSF